VFIEGQECSYYIYIGWMATVTVGTAGWYAWAPQRRVVNASLTLKGCWLREPHGMTLQLGRKPLKADFRDWMTHLGRR
jgi:hypothetical protein